jgi:hypothetical protein
MINRSGGVARTSLNLDVMRPADRASESISVLHLIPNVRQTAALQVTPASAATTTASISAPVAICAHRGVLILSAYAYQKRNSFRPFCITLREFGSFGGRTRC